MVFDCQIPRFFEVITAAAERLSVSPGRRYRAWSREEKERVVGETFFAGGERVGDCAVSRDPSQLFAWRRKALASGLVAPLSGARPRSNVLPIAIQFAWSER
jgi:transposase